VVAATAVNPIAIRSALRIVVTPGRSRGQPGSQALGAALCTDQVVRRFTGDIGVRAAKGNRVRYLVSSSFYHPQHER